MAREIRARYSNGVFEPYEEPHLEEGQEVTILVPEGEGGKGMREALRASAGAWRGLVDAEELKRRIYEDRLVSTRPEPRL